MNPPTPVPQKIIPLANLISFKVRSDTFRYSIMKTKSRQLTLVFLRTSPVNPKRMLAKRILIIFTTKDKPEATSTLEYTEQPPSFLPVLPVKESIAIPVRYRLKVRNIHASTEGPETHLGSPAGNEHTSTRNNHSPPQYRLCFIWVSSKYLVIQSKTLVGSASALSVSNLGGKTERGTWRNCDLQT